MNKAVVMTVCQRPFYLKPVLDGWSKVRGVDKWPFIFMVENTPTRDGMLRVINEWEHPSFLKNIVLNDKKLGVLENPYQGFNLAFVNWDFVVLAEEDLLPATNVLEYFEFASEFAYRDPKTVIVCAQGDGDNPWQLEYRNRFKVWLWGTWKDRWNSLIEPTWDHDYSTSPIPAVAPYKAPQSGWDWNLDMRIIPGHNKRCIYPGQTLVDNLGKYGGAHAIPGDYEKERPIGFVQDLPQLEFIPPMIGE